MPDTPQQVAEGYFADLFQFNRARATELGIHNRDGQLGDYSEAAVDTVVRNIKGHLARLEQVDVTRLKGRAASDFSLLRSDMHSNLLWYDRLADWRRNPDFYPSLALHALYLLCIRDFAPIEERMASLCARLQAVPKFFEDAARTLTCPPLLFTEVAIESAEGSVEFFQGQVPEFARLVPSLESDVLAANSKALVSLTNYIDFLKSKLSALSTGRFAVGDELLVEILRQELVDSVSLDEVAGLGEQTFADTQAELRKIARVIDPNKPWPLLVSELRRNHPAADALLQAYRDELDRLYAFVSEHAIVSLPSDAPLAVVATPAFARSTLPYAAYIPPAPFETAQRGEFWVTPTLPSESDVGVQSRLEEHDFYSLALTAIHEAYPGHHLQLVTANRSDGALRKHFCNTTMVEGWAFYCEQMMMEQGYLSDKRAQLFQLKDQLWRAARVIIDVGLQTGKMQVEEAVRLLVDGVCLSEDAARAEVRRYAMSPGQPLSYMLGKQAIIRLRKEHSGIPLRQFHDRLLSCGSVPVSIARQEIFGCEQAKSETG